MHEIKFRARHIQTGEWYYGSSLYTDFKTPSDYILPLSAFWQQVEKGVLDISTKGEYTGLKDKNGVEGYFDDLVRWGKSIYQVIWDETEGAAWLRRVKGDEVWSKLRIHLIEDGEVIGNIYSNKELIE